MKRNVGQCRENNKTLLFTCLSDFFFRFLSPDCKKVQPQQAPLTLFACVCVSVRSPPRSHFSLCPVKGLVYCKRHTRVHDQPTEHTAESFACVSISFLRLIASLLPTSNPTTLPVHLPVCVLVWCCHRLFEMGEKVVGIL